MRVKFNKYERVAGLFVLGAVAGTIVIAIGVAVKRGWLEAKREFVTSIQSAEGVRPGTAVLMQGLRIGEVRQVELVSSQQVRVNFVVGEAYWDKVREDSVVRVMRPFIIGDKVLDLGVGSSEREVLLAGAQIKSEVSTDLMELLNGRTVGPFVEIAGKMAENLKIVAEAFLDPERSRAMIRMFDELSPLLRNANRLTGEANRILAGVNKQDQLIITINNLAKMTEEMSKLLPMVAKDSPEMLQHLSKIAKNTAVLTEELSKAVPEMQKIAPELPRASRRAIEALDETVVTLKALQKSFLLRGSAREVREEEAAKNSAPRDSDAATQERRPAGD
ncbi:MAG TPA: MlaD family protein [Pseudobdellovibrionaceae bacterium]|nr:MlaD family protein [Pseudobdellovibrionaceae bacterium]